ncbi:MAG: pyridoxal phosphate-dependent aminotransferase family protein [Pseudomonadota bacterium]
MGILDKFDAVRGAYNEARANGRDPFGVRFDVIKSPTEGEIGGKSVTLMGTNNYLGLTFQGDCVNAAVDALRANGTGTTGSRIANGSYGLHVKLEQELARFFGRKHAMTFTTGYQANLGIIGTLAGRDDDLLIDADSHASIYDACKLSGARVTRFRHNSAKDLARRLKHLEGNPGHRIVVVEGIYSMHGDTAPLRELVAVAKDAGAYIIVDEAHSMGVLGKKGRGLAEATGVEDDVDFIVGTFSKSLGAIGGYCVSNIDNFDVLRVACRPYMFTASLPTSIVASTIEALHQIEKGGHLRERLMRNSRRLYNGLAAAGFIMGPEVTPVVPVKVDDAEVAITFWNGLLQEGLYCNLVLSTATPDGKPLLRCSVSAAHSERQIDEAIATFTKIGQALNAIPTPELAAAE